MNMKNLSEKLINILPYFILIFLLGSILIFIYNGAISYVQYLEILKTIIWPTIVLMSLLFFKKVFTYLFLSMEEFNFFGAKGHLKDVRDLIDERVEDRVEQARNQKEREEEIERITTEIERKEKTTNELDVKAKENIELATKLLNMYLTLSNEHNDSLKELEEFRRRQRERDARIASIRENVRKRRLSDVKEEEME